MEKFFYKQKQKNHQGKTMGIIPPVPSPFVKSPPERKNGKNVFLGGILSDFIGFKKETVSSDLCQQSLHTKDQKKHRENKKT